MIGRSLVAAVAVLISSNLPGVPGNVASAAEIKILYVGALRSSMAELIPNFEKSTGHKVNAEAGAAGAMVSRIQKGEAVDVAIVTTSQVAALVTQGKIVSGTQANIAKVGMGMGARAGAAKPDISSVDAFQRTLLAAKSIGHTDPASGASSAIYAARLLAKLDIAAEIKPKIKIFASNPLLFEAVAKGEIELAFGQMTEIMAKPTIVLVGPLPASLQNFSQFSGGVPANATQPEAGEALIKFLTSPAAAAIMKAKGVEPF
jgi:molybdate transport system substrate-binding protein